MTPTEAKAILVKVQNLVGTDPDGQWGPLSQRALDNVVHRSLEHEDPPSGAHPFIAVAAEWVGIQETSHNHFPGMEKLWKDATDYPNGYEDRAPYCAAFQCHVVAEAARRGAKVTAKPTTASVGAFRSWARDRGWLKSSPQPGDQFTLLPSGTSHIGLVECVDTASGVIHTIEGNTGALGERDGDGFWRKTRRITNCDFIRIPVA
jgi:hypothetical protein